MKTSKFKIKSVKKDILFSVIAFAIVLIAIEVFSIILVYFRYRDKNTALAGYSSSATILIVERAFDMYRRLREPKSLQIPDRTLVEPSPFFFSDNR